MSLYQGIARYMHVINPSAPRGTNEKKYGINLLIHKSDPQVAQITAEIEAAKANGFPNGFPHDAKSCWKDCALVEPDNAAIRDYMVLVHSTPETSDKPLLVDANTQPVLNPGADGEATGQIVWVDGGVAPYTTGNGGVKCYLNGVMLTGQMGPIPKEALSQRPSAQQMFAAATGAPAAGAGQPPVGQPPVGQPPVGQPPQPPQPPMGQPPQPQYQMTPAATGTREQYHAQGWSDDQLIQHGLMVPPGGVAPSWG